MNQAGDELLDKAIETAVERMERVKHSRASQKEIDEQAQVVAKLRQLRNGRQNIRRLWDIHQ